MKKLLILLMIMSILSLYGCSNDNILDNNTIIVDTEQLYTESIQFISGESTDNLELFLDELSISIEDCYLTDQQSSYLCYTSKGAYYIQIGKYMYRFQLNKNGLVESYIKYTVEA